VTPEEEARLLIDAGLAKAGWVVQDRDEMNLVYRARFLGHETDLRHPA